MVVSGIPVLALLKIFFYPTVHSFLESIDEEINKLVENRAYDVKEVLWKVDWATCAVLYWVYRIVESNGGMGFLDSKDTFSVHDDDNDGIKGVFVENGGDDSNFHCILHLVIEWGDESSREDIRRERKNKEGHKSM